ncbi:MAG: hypothetical protein QG671_176 [Actinomycetota bacterium]|nr:hypothetical protein [Actinomycetota bacterium]
MSVSPVIAEGTYAEDLHLAWHHSRLPFDHLDDAGALPDSVAHSEVLHNFVKPPIHGWAFGHLRRLLPRALTLDELEQAYQRLARWTVFWLDHRRVPGHDLPHYQHGNDSGWDNATTFDGERLLETADLAAFLTLQLCEPVRPAGELGDDDAAAQWDRTAVNIRAALMASLWDGSRFGARSATTGRCGSSSSLLGLMPVTLGPVQACATAPTPGPPTATSSSAQPTRPAGSRVDASQVIASLVLPERN